MTHSHAIKKAIEKSNTNEDANDFLNASLEFRVQGRGAIPSLIELLRSSDLYSQTFAFFTLRTNVSFFHEELIDILKQDTEPNVKRWIVLFFKDTNDERIIEPLIKLLNDDDQCCRLMAASVLNKTGNQKALKAVELFFKSQDKKTREFFNEILLKDQEAIDLLPIIFDEHISKNCFRSFCESKLKFFTYELPLPILKNPLNSHLNRLQNSVSEHYEDALKQIVWEYDSPKYMIPSKRELPVPLKKNNFIEYENSIKSFFKGIDAQNNGHIYEAKKLFLQSLEFSKEMGNVDLFSKNAHNLGVLNLNEKNFEDAKEWLKLSIIGKQKLGDNLGLAKSSFQLGRIFQDQNNLCEAKDWFNQSLKFSQKIEDKTGIFATMYQLAIIEFLNGNLKEAEKSCIESLKISDERQHLAASNFLIGIIYQNLNRNDQAEISFRKSLELFKEINEKSGIASVSTALANFLLKNNQREEAIKLYQDAEFLFKQTNNLRGASFVRQELNTLTCAG